MDETERRLSELERWRIETEAVRPYEKERDKHVDQRFDALERRLAENMQKQEEEARWLKRSVIVLLIGAAAQFVLRGGLSLGAF